MRPLPIGGVVEHVDESRTGNWRTTSYRRHRFRPSRSLFLASTLPLQVAEVACAFSSNRLLVSLLYWSRIPAPVITLLIRTMSDFIVAADCSGEMPTTSTPELKNLSFKSALFRTRTVSWLSRLISVSSVLAGANIPIINADSYPGSPEAATVGKPGASADGSALVTARALNLPDLTCGIPAFTATNITCTSPAIRALSAGPVLL